MNFNSFSFRDSLRQARKIKNSTFDFDFEDSPVVQRKQVEKSSIVISLSCEGHADVKLRVGMVLSYSFN